MRCISFSMCLSGYGVLMFTFSMELMGKKHYIRSVSLYINNLVFLKQKCEMKSKTLLVHICVIHFHLKEHKMQITPKNDMSTILRKRKKNESSPWP